jgi:hypothetical protein
MVVKFLDEGVPYFLYVIIDDVQGVYPAPHIADPCGDLLSLE